MRSTQLLKSIKNKKEQIIKNKGGNLMNFIKGMMLGTAITAAAYMMYEEGMFSKRKICKQAKKLVRKMGMDF